MMELYTDPIELPARPYALIVRSTDRCKVGCSHCSIEATGKGSDLRTDLLADVLKQAKIAGVGLIHFSGGEPLLNRELEEQIGLASAHGFFVEVTSSTWTLPGDDPSERLKEFVRKGLQRVMLSYDGAHARRVPIEHYSRFLKTALDLDLEVCANVVDWEDSAWPLERVRAECAARGCDVDRVDWCRAGLSLVGRATQHEAAESTHPSAGTEARCPYVLTAPTLAPNGDVYLCPNVQSRSSLFRLGNVTETPLQNILARMSQSDFFRALADRGPGPLLASIDGAGARQSASCDMCTACQTLLSMADGDSSVRRSIEGQAPPKDATIPLDIEALLPGHRRFVLGESRPEKGCICG